MVAARTGWSVTAVGPARAVTDPAEHARLRALPLTPWAPGEHDHLSSSAPTRSPAASSTGARDEAHPGAGGLRRGCGLRGSVT
ncbi:pyridoxamine 5'-phosphate oxidase family protein [Streptosporangiaceae bacterium NEAU-GS5]|nr:pyridoxamine 5'-phosphate oxidase family protein [Streptosporangiaceae bacterium NEAU-GS5]